jgi:CheY-like chemotaxis protein
MFEIEAATKNITIEKEEITPIKGSYITDEVRITQILCNLLANALKFSKNNVKIGIKIDQRVHDNHEYFIFEITDQGCGMNSQELQRLRRLLQKKDMSERVSEGSSGGGLGLTITQVLLELMASPSGLQYSSFPDQGTQVWFEVPLIREDANVSLKQVELRIESYHKLATVLLEENGKVSSQLKSAWTVRMRYSGSGQIAKAHSPVHREKTGKLGSAAKPFTVSLKPEMSNISEDVAIEPRGMSPPKIFEIKQRSQIFTEMGTGMGHDMNKSKSVVPVSKHGCDCQLVLIVDDNTFNISSLATMLKVIGYPSIHAQDGIDAIEMVKKTCAEAKPCCTKCHMIRIIFMDINMPRMDGIEATKQLIKMMNAGEIPWIPIVACTAYSLAQEIEGCLEAGMVDAITKPVNIQRLKKVMTKC